MATEKKTKDTAPKRSNAKPKGDKTASAIQQGADNEPVTIAEVTPTEPDESGKAIEVIAEHWIEKSNLSKSIIAGWKQDYEGLKVLTLEDKDGFEKIKAAKKFIQTKRTGLGDFKSEKKAPFLAACNKIESDYKEYKTLLEQIEEPLDAEIEKFKAWEKEENERAEKEASERLDKRVKELKANGLQFDGEYYSIGDIAVDGVFIKTVTEANYEIFLMKVKFAADKINKEKEAQRLKDEADAEERRKEGERLKDEAKRIDDECAAQEKERKAMEDEKAEMRRERMNLRQQQLEGLGMNFGTALIAYQFKNDFGTVTVESDKIANYSNEDFFNVLAEAKETISDLKQKQTSNDAEIEKEREAHAIRYQLRVNMLSGINMLFVNSSKCFVFQDNGQSTNISIADSVVKEFTPDDFSGIFDEQVIKIENYRKEKQDEKERKETEAAEAEQKRAGYAEAAKPEIQKVRDYFERLMLVTMPSQMTNASLAVLVLKTNKGLYSLIEAGNIELDKMNSI